MQAANGNKLVSPEVNKGLGINEGSSQFQKNSLS